MSNVFKWSSSKVETSRTRVLFCLIQRPAKVLPLWLFVLVSMMLVWQSAVPRAVAWAGSSAPIQFASASADRVDARLRVVGSTTIQPVVQRAAKRFPEHAGNEIILQGGGSSFGIASVRDKSADIGMVSRSLSHEEMEEFGHAFIGYDALAIIVNSHNTKQRVSREELRDIYTGRTATWPDGFEGQSDIVLVSKLVGRGTLEVFEAYTGLLSPLNDLLPANEQNTISESAWEAGANLDSILWVGGIRGAIGFVSVGEAQSFIRIGMSIRMLEVDNMMPTPELVIGGEYPLRRELNLVYLRGNPQAEAFVRFMLTELGLAAVLEQGFIPASDGLKEGQP